jgi:hypothetical protein
MQVDGIVTQRGVLCCGNPRCGKTLGKSDNHGTTTLRCLACKTDNLFSIPIHLTNALENYCLGLARAAEAFSLIAAMSAGAAVSTA